MGPIINMAAKVKMVKEKIRMSKEGDRTCDSPDKYLRPICLLHRSLYFFFIFIGYFLFTFQMLFPFPVSHP